MPDLVTTANQLKGVPDQWLQKELAAPTGSVPGYLVLAEAQRRATLRSGGAQNKQQQASSVYDDVLRNLTSGAPPAGPPTPPGMASPASGLGQLAQGGPPPPQNFKPPQAMATGGSVDDSDDALPSYAKPGPYQTLLAPRDEDSFRTWVQKNKVPFEDSPQADYDMRGFYQAMQAGKAKQAKNLHFPDTWKTPYHKSFSNESMYATPEAPRWKGNKLIDKSGRVIFDETPIRKADGGSMDEEEEDYLPPSTGSASRSAEGEPTGDSTHKSAQHKYDDYVQASAARNNVNPNMVRAVMKNESNFKRDAVSPKGATGLMQLTEGTARDMGVKDRKNPAQSIEGGARYLRWLGDYLKTDDPKLILAGYNAGPGAVKKYNGVPPFKETKNYINRVKGTLYSLENKPKAQPTAGVETAPQTAEADVSPPELTPAAADPSALTMAALNNWGSQPEGPAPPPAGGAPAAPAEENIDPYSDKNIERQRKMFAKLYGSKAEPGAALKAEIARMRTESARLAKPSGWQMLADFGWGMAASPEHSLFSQIGAGGQAMSKGMANRMEQARKRQLELLGIDVKLDDQARDAQEKIAGLTGQAVNQAANKQISDFEALTTPGMIRGNANESPGANYRYVPNPTGGQGKWMPPTTGEVTTEMLPLLKGMRNSAGKEFQAGDVISATQLGKIQDKLTEMNARKTEKSTAPATRDAQLFTGASQTVGGRYEIPDVSDYLDLPETLVLTKPVKLPENVRRPDGTMYPAGTVLPVGATVYPRQEAEALYNRSSIERAGATQVTKMFDSLEGRTQIADQMQLDPASKEVFVKTGKFPSSPALMQSLVEQVANYQIPWSGAVSRLPPADREIFAAALKKENKDFNESHYANARKTEADFLGGKKGDRLISINAALGHTGILVDAADALRSGATDNFRRLNQIANFFKAEIGATPAQTFKSIVHAVGPELVKVYVPGAGTGEDRAKVEADFADSLPPDQIRNNAAARAKLLGGVMDSMIHQYQVGTYGRGKEHVNFFTPQSVATLERLAPGSFKAPTLEGAAPVAGGGAGAGTGAGATGKIVVKTGDNKTIPFDSEEEAQRFEALVKKGGGTTERQP